MRLEQREINGIKSTILAFDQNAIIYLFGSRIDDTAKGGDIDLMVLSDIITFENKVKIKVKLYDAIGEQKIDLLIAKNRSTDPFVNVVKKEGIIL